MLIILMLISRVDSSHSIFSFYLLFGCATGGQRLGFILVLSVFLSALALSTMSVPSGRHQDPSGRG
jgi:hypothetical protein